MSDNTPYTLVVFDTETTGVHPHIDDEMCQFACIAVKSTDPENILEFESLCDPGRPIPAEAMAKHGIPNEAVQGKTPAPELAKAIMAELIEFAAGTQLILGGHNTKFDWGFLRKHVEIPAGTLSLCTLRMARILSPHSDNHQLEHLYRNQYQLQSDRTKTAHDALCDVWMSYELLQHWLKERSDLDVLEIAQELQLPLELETMPFGKNKGRPFAGIPRQALKWFVDQGDAMDLDVRYTAGKWCGLWQDPTEMMARVSNR